MSDYHRQDPLPSANHATQPVLFAVQYGLLGGHMHLHLLLTVALGALLSLALYVLVRELGALLVGARAGPAGFHLPACRIPTGCGRQAGWNNLAVACYFAVPLALRGTR